MAKASIKVKRLDLIVTQISKERRRVDPAPRLSRILPALHRAKTNMSTMAAKILVFQGEDPLVTRLTDQLKVAGYEVITANRAECPIQTVADMRPDLIIIDWLLPAVSGTGLCRDIRTEAKSWTPRIMMLSARKEDAACLRSFEAGADDYVVKTVSAAEFLARVNALLRRGSTPRSAGDQGNNGINIDHGAHRVTRAKRQIKLGPIEYRILECFVSRTGRLVTREQLMEYAWASGASEIKERTVDVYIGRLRDAIVQGDERDPIRTVRGEGYVFEGTS